MHDCRRCGCTEPEVAFRQAVEPGLKPRTIKVCRLCEADEAKARREARKLEADRRLASSTEALKPGDLSADEYSAPDYDREKKQEYNANMGRFGQVLRELGTDEQAMAGFISLTAEQETRWLGKRLSRSVSLGAARELLFVRQFEAMAQRVTWPIRSSGYASRPKETIPNRGLFLGLSDLHIGANLPGYENPTAFNFLTASRRLARLVHETAEYKTQYRDQTELVLALDGDLIEGLLGWNDADNAPFAEQQVACCQFLAQAIERLAAAFPRVRVVCETGNHGRNKLTHQGRATSSKWNSQEFVIYKFLQQQCRGLGNTAFQIPLGPNAVVDLLGKRAVVTHGDTEHLLKSPSRNAHTWGAAIDRMNSSGSAGGPVDLFFAGHFHDPQMMPFENAIALSNGALVPSNGHARTAGYSSVCGQWLFEFTPKWVFGDNRFLRVGRRDDDDATLDDIIAPFESDRPAESRP